MQSVTRFTSLVALAALVGCATTHKDVGSASSPRQDDKMHAQGGGEMQLPAGWTAADMQKMMAAGTPGKEQQMLARGAGRWTGTSEHWMAPGMPSTSSPMTSTVTSLMDGRYVKIEVSGEMPGFGTFQGLGYNAFDNVSKKYVSVWMDNFSTGMMTGEGTLSADGKTMTWSYVFNCPIQGGPAKMREVEHYTGENTMTLEMFGNDPKSGKEFKMMHMDMTRQSM